MGRILITGGAGSLGRLLIERLRGRHEITSLDRDEHLLWELSRRHPEVRLVLGDCRNPEDLADPVRWADVVIHAAAYKNLEITELHPLATCENDFLGTVNVVRALRRSPQKKFVLVSTDKAVYPVSSLGAAKLLAERFVLESSEEAEALLSVARFVNVVETRGNVFEVWRRQQAEGRPFEITDARMERHFNIAPGVQDLFEAILDEMKGGEVFIPDVPRQQVVDRFREIYGEDQPFVETGIRRHERLYDPLFTEEEAPFVERCSGHLKIDYRKLRRSLRTAGESPPAPSRTNGHPRPGALLSFAQSEPEPERDA